MLLINIFNYYIKLLYKILNYYIFIMKQKGKTKKKNVCFNCDRLPSKKLKTCKIKNIDFSSNDKYIRRPNRSLSTKLPMNFVPRLHPKKSKIKASPLKLNRKKSSHLREYSDYIIDKQFSDEEESFFDVLTESSSSSGEKDESILKKKINDIEIKSCEINEKPKNEINNQEKKEEKKKSSFKSHNKFNKTINNSIQEYKNEDKDLNNEGNLKVNDLNKNIISPSNENKDLEDNDIYRSIRFSSEVSDFKKDEENKNNEVKNIPSIKPFNEEDQQSFANDNIKILRKRMARIRTKTTKEKLKETAEIIHNKMIKNFDMRLENDNEDNTNDEHHNNKRKVTFISNSINTQDDGTSKRKKSMSILEMLKFSQKGKK